MLIMDMCNRVVTYYKIVLDLMLDSKGTYGIINTTVKTSKLTAQINTIMFFCGTSLWCGRLCIFIFILCVWGHGNQ